MKCTLTNGKHADRPNCIKCNKNLCAINYIKEDRVYYRSMCVTCINLKKKRKSAEVRALLQSGYKKKTHCDRCNFQAKHPIQLSIVFLDGNRLNASRDNLRTYCANCIAEVSVLPVRRSSLVPDY